MGGVHQTVGIGLILEILQIVFWKEEDGLF
jgi:hypothetical protein